jgi:hypothetical protein
MVTVEGNRGGALRAGRAALNRTRRGMGQGSDTGRVGTLRPRELPGGERKQEKQGQQSNCEGYSNEVEFAEVHGRHPVVLSPPAMLGRTLLTKGYTESWRFSSAGALRL